MNASAASPPPRAGGWLDARRHAAERAHWLALADTPGELPVLPFHIDA